MTEVILLDTSVYLNVLDVPGFNQNREGVFDEFERLIECESHFLLPLVTVWETGNHIARLGNGTLRRQFALKLVEDVEKACNGDAPYAPTYFPDKEIFLTWLKNYPEFAMRNKLPDKPGEGISLVDFAIIQEWERACERFRNMKVRIWSLDADLGSYDRHP